MVDCVIILLIFGNIGNWLEVIIYFLFFGILWLVNVYFINLDKWNSFFDEDKVKLEVEFVVFEDVFWVFVKENNGWVIVCNIGGEVCENYIFFSMELVVLIVED